MKGYNLSEMEITLKKFFKYRTLRAKKVLMSIILLSSAITLSKTLDNINIEQFQKSNKEQVGCELQMDGTWNCDNQIKFAKYELEISNDKHTDLKAVDYKFADYFLTKTKINREIADEFLIILPDVRILEEQREKISKFGKDVIVFMLKGKNEKLKYRSFEELNNVKFAKNVKIITLSLDDEETDRFITDAKNNSLYFQDYFKYKFYGKYKKITRFNYLEAINHE